MQLTQNMPRPVFFVLHSLWEFLRKNRDFLEKCKCTGKREVVCKKTLQPMLFQETSVFLKKATQRTRSKKKKHAPGRVFFWLPCPRSLTDSLALGSMGGNSNLKQNLGFIKVL